MPAKYFLLFWVLLLWPISGFATEKGADYQAPVLPIGVGGAEKIWAPQSGFQARAIARWNVVPFQKIDTEIEIGVVAFHMNGIERVDFSANGGKIISVRIPKFNKRTKVLEYSVRLQVEGLKDQKIDLRATAIPNSGVSRDLEPLILFANAQGRYDGKTVYVTNKKIQGTENGTEKSPFSSIAKALKKAGDGGRVILLDPGFYSLAGKTGLKGIDTWISIEGRSNLDRRNIILGLKERKLVRLDVDKLKFKNVSLDVGSYIQIYPEITTFVWFDDVRWFDGKGWAYKHKGQNLIPVRTSKYIGGYFVTKSVSEDSLYGFPDAKLVRNSHLERISGDALQGVQMVLNVTVNNMDGNVRAHHSDILQYFGDFDNVIVFGLKATNIYNTQNIFLDHYKSTFQNMAFVNIAVDNKKGNPPFTQLNSRQNHILFYYLSMPSQSWILRDDMPNKKKFAPKNVIIKNSILGMVKRGKNGWKGLPMGMNVSNTHFTSGEAHGQAATRGPISFERLLPKEIIYAGRAVPFVKNNATTIFAYMDTHGKIQRDIPMDKGAYSFY